MKTTDLVLLRFNHRVQFWLLITCLFLLLLPGSIEAQDEAANPEQPVAQQDSDQSDSGEDANKGAEVKKVAQTTGHLVRVPLPITSRSAERVIAAIDRAIEKSGGNQGQPRPVLVLEFDNTKGANGVGSDFYDAQKIARLLTSQKLSQFRTVAYLPGIPAGTKELFPDEEQVASLEGHAVLVAVSCEEIVMHKDAAIGNAGSDVELLDETHLQAYRTFSEKRRPLPSPVVLSMLDKNMVVYRVELKNDGVKYVGESEFLELEKGSQFVNSVTLSDVNNFGFYSSEDLQTYRLIRHRVESRREIADRYNLPATALEGDPSLGEDWKAIRITVNGPVSDRMVSWIDKALGTRIDEDINLIIVEIDSPGGEAPAALRLAKRLSEFDPLKVRTVAFVPSRARGIASVIAFGCDHVLMKEDAVLGGEGRPEIPPTELGTIKDGLMELAKTKETNWSLSYALLDPGFEAKRYKNRATGRIRVVSEAELQLMKDKDVWQELNVVAMENGIDGATAENLSVIRGLANDFEELKSFYQLDEEPEILEPTLTDKWVENLAHQLASPRIAWMILFGAIFFMSMEFSNPGVGVPGFLSVICWMLFFWSQYFHGNATVLEILLFIAGITFILMELFVLPGFGIFGIGGIIMVTTSIILAVQTFVIPRNSAEIGQLTTSMLTFLGAASGFLVSMFVFHRYLDKLPVFNRIMLKPELDEVEVQTRHLKETLVDYSELIGKSGIAHTKLMPSGKAIIDQELYNVITDGRMIESGTEVIVKNTIGNKIEVSPKDG